MSDQACPALEVRMKGLLKLTVAVEAAAGVGLVVDPSFVARLLFGEGLHGAGADLGRLAGFALVSLGLACWPGSLAADECLRARGAMLTYNLLATIYLLYLRLDSLQVGPLLWPALLVHAILTCLLVGTWFTGNEESSL